VLRPNGTIAVPVPVRSLPATLSGAYTLLTQVTDTSGSTAISSGGPSLTAAAPFLAFSQTLVRSTLASSDVSGQKTAASETIRITNNGNVASTGHSTIAVDVSPDTSAGDGTLVRSQTVPLVLAPGASRQLTIPLLALPAVPDGNYFLVNQVTDPNGGTSSVASGVTYTLAAPFVSLVPSAAGVTIARNGAAILGFTVTNAGNVASSGTSTLSVLASTDGTASNAATAFSESLPLVLRAHALRAVRLRLSAAQVMQLHSAAAAILQVTDANGEVQALTLTGF
jgi:hypothetical protein